MSHSVVLVSAVAAVVGVRRAWRAGRPGTTKRLRTLASRLRQDMVAELNERSITSDRRKAVREDWRQGPPR